MITKTVDKQGRIVLGRQFANTTVLVDESDATRIVITPAKVLPRTRLGSIKTKKLPKAFSKGFARRRMGKFAKSPPDIDADLEEPGE